MDREDKEHLKEIRNDLERARLYLGIIVILLLIDNWPQVKEIILWGNEVISSKWSSK